MATSEKLNNLFISPKINEFTLVHMDNCYNLWFKDDIVRTIEDVKKPTTKLSDKLLVSFPKYNSNKNDYPKEVNEIYESIVENNDTGADSFNILKDLFITIVAKKNKMENLKTSSDRIKNTYIDFEIDEESNEVLYNLIHRFLENNYQKTIDDIRDGKTKTIYINCNLLKKYYWDLGNEHESLFSMLERSPASLIDEFNQVLEYSFIQDNKSEYYVKFDYPDELTKMNDLLSDKIGSFIKTTAIVKGVYEITPVINIAVFECVGCGRFHEVKQTSGNTITEPTICDSKDCGGRSFRLLQNECSYYNTRQLYIEEPVEELGNRTKAKSMSIFLTGEGEFLNKANIGDRINITGVLDTYKDEKSGRFKFYIAGNNIEKLGDNSIEISEDEEKQIIELSKDKDIFDKLINSTANDLILDDEVKQGILCSMVGGGVNDGGRSEIHGLIISNPGTAKSDLFDWMKNTTDKCIMTSGASSSGVGLTGAIDKDSFTGQNILKAGALVLASGGICIGDELDKLNKTAFGQLNNMIEKGFESFHKGGINETLYCNSTFVGGANFKYERYDKYKKMKEQIKFPASFLSRMDYIFIFKDDNFNEDIVDIILDRYTGVESEVKKTEIEHDLLKKYLYYAKTNFNPVLTKEAKAKARTYAKDILDFMNVNDTRDIVEFTFSRFINSIARLSGAIAKLHLRNEILVSDVEKVIDLKNYCFNLMGYDTENGVVVDVVVNGETSSSKKEKQQIILNIINEEKENPDGVYINDYGVQKQFIKTKFVELTKLSERSCENIIDELYDDNVLIKRKYGRYMCYDIKEI